MSFKICPIPASIVSTLVICPSAIVVIFVSFSIFIIAIFSFGETSTIFVIEVEIGVIELTL